MLDFSQVLSEIQNNMTVELSIVRKSTIEV